MKRRILVRMLLSAGFSLKGHGGKHDIYVRGKDTEEVPRHTEINEITARRIIKRWGLK